LKEVAPSVTRTGMLFNPETAPRRGELFLAPFIAAGASLGIGAEPAAVHDVQGLEPALAALAGPSGGLVVASDSFNLSHYGEIVALAAR
jgi:putative tryptophan/tyrosine transport system substrate-binding protein